MNNGLPTFGGDLTPVKNIHEDLKRWQKSNEKSSRRVFWASIAMIALAAVQIVVAVCS